MHVTRCFVNLPRRRRALAPFFRDFFPDLQCGPCPLRASGKQWASAPKLDFWAELIQQFGQPYERVIFAVSQGRAIKLSFSTIYKNTPLLSLWTTEVIVYSDKDGELKKCSMVSLLLYLPKLLKFKLWSILMGESNVYSAKCR